MRFNQDFEQQKSWVIIAILFHIFLKISEIIQNKNDRKIMF